jgi:lipoprotein Spr
MINVRFVNILCVTLMALFALTVLGPTDAESAVRSKTASLVKSGKSSVTKAPSKKKRRIAKKSLRRGKGSCNTAAGKQQAIDLLRTQSAELCKMAGLEYVSTGALADSVRSSVTDDGEDLTDVDTDESTAALGAEVMSPEDQADQDQEMLELEAEDDVTVDEESFRSLWLNYVDADGDGLTEAGIEKEVLLNNIMDWLGTRYHFGGTSQSGIDCSAFTRQVYASSGSVELPRSASEQSTIGVPIKKMSDLQFGDLVFFNTRRRVLVSHVGIYLGDNLFAHASSRFGVTVSSLESTYYNKRFLGGSRLDERTVAQLAQGTVQGM